jgi:hypothetical protein
MSAGCSFEQLCKSLDDCLSIADSLLLHFAPERLPPPRDNRNTPTCMRKLLVILNAMLHNKTHWHAR